MIIWLVLMEVSKQDLLTLHTMVNKGKFKEGLDYASTQGFTCTQSRTGILFIRCYLGLNDPERALCALSEIKNPRRKCRDLIFDYYVNEGDYDTAFKMFEDSPYEKVSSDLVWIFKEGVSKKIKHLVLNRMLWSRVKVCGDYGLEKVLGNTILGLKRKCLTDTQVEKIRLGMRITDSRALERKFPKNTVIIDGANVLHSGKGKKSMPRLYDMYRRVKSDGFYPVVVLNWRYCVHDMDFMNSERGMDDDCYSIYFSIKLKVPVVTNDEFRNHIFKYPELAEWFPDMLAKYDDGGIKYPQSYTHCIQKTHGKYYIPTVEDGVFIVQN